MTMRRLNTRAPRIAGLLALALGAVALLAVSGVAAAKDRGGDDHGHHHGRHHDHGRHNGRHFDMREAGTISTFDATSGKLTITLLEGGTVTGLVTDRTEIKCEGVDDRRARRDHGSSSSSGGSGQNEPGDDHGGRGNDPGDDNGGHGNEPGDDNGGATGAPPAGEASCSTASLVPGTVVGDAELRLEGGTAFFVEVEVGNHS
jgi:hypothetical protein